MSALAGLDKGRAWEFRVHRAVFLSGWYVRQGVNLRERVEGSPQTMAEVDILGLSFDVALSPQTLVGECKNRKGGAKEADRVVWLLGLRQALSSQHVLFAKPVIADGTYVWSRPLNVVLWDEAAVRATEQRFGLGPSEGYLGSFNPRVSELRTVCARKTSAYDPLFRRAWHFIAGGFWYTPNTVRVKRLPAYFEAIRRGKDLTDREQALFFAEGLIALIAAALTTGGQLQRLSPGRASAFINEEFASGVANAAALKEIAARADDFYRDAFTKAGRQASIGSAMKLPRLADHVAQPPPWLPEYLELSRKLAELSHRATDVLRFADLLLFSDVIDEPVTGLVERLIAGPQDELLKLVQLTGYFLRRAWGIESAALEMLLNPDRKRTDGKVESLATGGGDVTARSL